MFAEPITEEKEQGVAKTLPSRYTKRKKMQVFYFLGEIKVGNSQFVFFCWYHRTNNKKTVFYSNP